MRPSQACPLIYSLTKNYLRLLCPRVCTDVARIYQQLQHSLWGYDKHSKKVHCTLSTCKQVLLFLFPGATTKPLDVGERPLQPCHAHAVIGWCGGGPRLLVLQQPGRVLPPLGLDDAGPPSAQSQTPVSLQQSQTHVQKWVRLPWDLLGGILHNCNLFICAKTHERSKIMVGIFWIPSSSNVTLVWIQEYFILRNWYLFLTI